MYQCINISLYQYINISPQYPCTAQTQHGHSTLNPLLCLECKVELVPPQNPVGFSQAVTKLSDKMPLEVFLASKNRFRWIGGDRIKKQTQLSALGSFAIKYRMTFQGNPALVWISSTKEATPGREGIQHRSLSHTTGARWGFPGVHSCPPWEGDPAPTPGFGSLL